MHSPIPPSGKQNPPPQNETEGSSPELKQRVESLEGEWKGEGGNQLKVPPPSFLAHLPLIPICFAHQALAPPLVLLIKDSVVWCCLSRVPSFGIQIQVPVPFLPHLCKEIVCFTSPYLDSLIFEMEM